MLTVVVPRRLPYATTWRSRGGGKDGGRMGQEISGNFTQQQDQTDDQSRYVSPGVRRAAGYAERPAVSNGEIRSGRRPRPHKF